MKRRRLLLAGACGALTAVRGRAAAVERERSPAALLQAQVATQGNGLVWMDVRAGEVEYRAATRPGAQPLDERTLFELGSVTKTFTALLLADGVLRGELRLDDAVESVLPDGIRLRDRSGVPLRWLDLATHRSGLPRLAANMKPADVSDPYADYRWPDLAQYLKQWQPAHGRGERFEYSNLGYGLLGQALAFRAGTSYAEMLRRRILDPLGMEGVRIAQAGQPSPARGHDAQGHPVPAWHFTDATAGAGAIVADARALARYARCALGLVEHPLQEAFSLCLRRHADGATPMNPVGLAWFLAPLGERTVFNHDGGTFGFSTSLWLDPARRRATAVLADAAIAVQRLALHLLDSSVPAPDIRGEQAAMQQAAAPVSAAALAVLAGVYALGPQFKVSIRADGERLFAQATGQAEFELFRKEPATARRYFARVAALEIEFDGQQGMPAAFTLHQGGQQLRFVREPQEPSRVGPR